MLATLLLSALAIAILTAIAWALGFRTDPRLDPAAARAEAEARLPGFQARTVELAAGGRGALVTGQDGSFALLLPLADGWLVRRIAAAQISRDPAGTLDIRLDEPMLRHARLTLNSANPAPA